MLDVACGTGVVTRLAAERVGGAAVVGADVHPGMLAVARKADPDGAIEWLEARAEALPLEDATFDVVLCQIGLQFFGDRRVALREMHRVLRPGGRVVLNVPGPMPPLLAVLEQALRRHVGPEAAGFVAAVFSLHDSHELRELLGSAGFTDTWARSEQKTLLLPRAEDFLWQYIFSTPLAEAVGTLDEGHRAELQREVVTAWETFAEDDGLVLEVDVTSATGRRA